MMTDNQTTHQSEVTELLLKYPDICYLGWKTPRLTESQFQEERRRLVESQEALDLCRRVFRDPRFRKKYGGNRSSYGMKHFVESWGFSPDRLREPGSAHYNGVYVCEGVAIAAALLEGFQCRSRSPLSPSCKVTVA